MNTTPTFSVSGKSGKTYTFYVYPVSTTFTPAQGVYMFFKYIGNTNGSINVSYIGITNDLSSRFDRHHKAAEIKSHGATHIGVYIQNSEQQRKADEADLLAQINTHCNELLN